MRTSKTITEVRSRGCTWTRSTKDSAPSIRPLWIVPLLLVSMIAGSCTHRDLTGSLNHFGFQSSR